MKSPIRYQSRLLIRRSYKPERVTRRRLGVTFQSIRPVIVRVLATGLGPMANRQS